MVPPNSDSQSTATSDDVTGSAAVATDSVVADPVRESDDDALMWVGFVDAEQSRLKTTFLACVLARPAEACLRAAVGGGVWLPESGAVPVGQANSAADKDGGRRSLQRPQSPRFPAPDHEPPIPTMPGSSAGAGAPAGSLGAALIALMSAVLGLLGLAASRAVSLRRRRPPSSNLIPLLERPG
jgi:hypothetical protein